MTVASNSIDISFNQGIDTKSAPNLVEAPSLLSASNGIFAMAGTIIKRNGFSSLSALPVAANGSTRSVVGAKLAVLNNELLAITSGGSVSSYSDGAGIWIGKGSVSPVSWDQNGIVNNTALQSNCTAASLSGITVFCWEDSRSGIRYSVQDEDTRMFILADKSLDTGGSNPHVVTGGGYINIVWGNNGTIFGASILPTTPTIISTPVSLASNAVTTSLRMDVITNTADTTSMLLAFQNTTGEVELAYLFANSALAQTVVVGTPFNGYVSPQSTIVPGDASIALVVAVDTAFTQIAFLLAASATSAFQSATISPLLVTNNIQTVDSSLSVVNVGGVCSGGLVTNCLVCYEESGSATYNNLCKLATVSNTTAPAAITMAGLRGKGMASMPFIGNDGNIYVILVYSDSLQPTLFLYCIGNANGSFSDGPAAGTLLGNGIPGCSGGLFTEGMVPRVFSPAALEYSLPITYRNQEESEPITNTSANTTSTYTYFFITGIDRLDLAWLPSADIRAVQAGADTYFSGGMTSVYDGISVVEAGNMVYPFTSSATFTPLATGGNMFPGEYGVVVVYLWYDQSKQQWFSAPSPSISVTIPSSAQATTSIAAGSNGALLPQSTINVGSTAGFPSSGWITVVTSVDGAFSNISYTGLSGGNQFTGCSGGTGQLATGYSVTGGTGSITTSSIPTLRTTNRSSQAPFPRADTIVQVYTTSIDNPSIWQLTGNGSSDPVTAPIVNNTEVDTVSWSRTVADAAIAGNQILYTTGGVVPNLLTPPASIIAVSGDRVFLAGIPREPFTVLYSNEWVTGQAAIFSSQLPDVIAPQDDGPITAIATLDVNVIIFKENSIYAFSGDGPDSTGNNNAFTDISLVSGDVGCISPESIVKAQFSIFFKSNKGIYHLDRSLNLDYIGASVEAYNQFTITSATLITNTTQLRFTTSGTGYIQSVGASQVQISNPVLVYDYFFKQWSTFTNISAVSAVNWASGGAFSITEGVNPSYVYVFLDSSGVLHWETTGMYVDNGSTQIPLSMTTAPIHLAGIQGYQRIQWLYFLAEYFSAHNLQVSIYYDNEASPGTVITIDPDAWINGPGYGQGNYGAGNYGGNLSSVYQFRIPVSRQLCQTIQLVITDTEIGSGQSYAIDKMTIIYGVQSRKNPLSRAGRLKTISNG